MERQSHRSLWIAGAATLAAGYVIAIGIAIGGAVYSASVPRNQCWSQAAGVGWIPFIGPGLAIANQSGHTAENGKPCQDIAIVYAPGVAIAVIDTVLQFAGAGMLAAGLAWRSEVPVPNEAQAVLGTPHLQLLPFAPGAPAGVSLSLDFR